jgi:hypothetical protein
MLTGQHRVVQNLRVMGPATLRSMLERLLFLGVATKKTSAKAPDEAQEVAPG